MTTKREQGRVVQGTGKQAEVPEVQGVWESGRMHRKAAECVAEHGKVDLECRKRGKAVKQHAGRHR